VLVNPPAEWTQMLREAYRMMRYRFWTEDMSQVDWDAMYEKYAALLGRITTRAEFSDLVWEMQGELGTSHAYEFGGDRRPAPRFQPGYLGADFAWDEVAGGWRITHIVQGDPAVSGHDSPLNAPGVNVAEGDVLVAVDGRRATAHESPEHLLMRRREQEVAVTVMRQGAAERTVVVKTLGSEMLARYREWVEKNRAYVHRESGGRVGYLHIPNMMAWGFSEFFRLHATEVRRPALIVDVRFNGGGHVSQLLLEKLAKRAVGYDFPRWGVPESYPMNAPRGPVVALTNDYAGSDGDIFSHSFKLMGIGKLVGRRTWGGVIGINPRYALVDGTLVTQPTGAFWFKDVGWGVENYGTDPDIVVEYPPEAYRAGEDPQLERTLQEALRELEKHPAEMPPADPRPSKAPPPLPPRR
jgi:tricorn protease